jgi:SnoaL-like polyketide cyclase
MRALPGLHLDVRHPHAGVSAVVVEVIIRSRHLGPWRGLPATGSQIEIPLCGIFTFDDEDRVAGEKIYYDRAALLRQLGLFHEPDSTVGRIGTMLIHPLTTAHVVGRKIWQHD